MTTPAITPSHVLYTKDRATFSSADFAKGSNHIVRFPGFGLMGGTTHAIVEFCDGRVEMIAST